MPRPTEALIDLSALRANLRIARDRARPSRIFAVVKANAYGHGLSRVLPALEEADGLALLEIDAAIRMRESGVRKPILLLQGFFDVEELRACARLGLTAVVHHPDQVAMLASAQLEHAVDVHVKINSGMNRLGFAPDAVSKVLADLKACGNVRDITAMTHFADADGRRGVDWQLERVRAALHGQHLQLAAANSAALLRYPQARGDWVRPGIMLYGSSPFADTDAAALQLKPVMTLRSQIIATQRLVAGDSVGYGCTFSTPRPMRIGVVACGYGDGYPRHAPTGTPVLVDGHQTGTVGLVSMDTLAVDLTALPAAGVGSPVTLWGRGLPVDAVARAAGTVSYELLCALKPRVAVVTAR